MVLLMVLLSLHKRLEGMYALLLVANLAAVDMKDDELLTKEKIWQ